VPRRLGSYDGCITTVQRCLLDLCDAIDTEGNRLGSEGVFLLLSGLGPRIVFFMFSLL
jgi:hypothetical protein